MMHDSRENADIALQLLALLGDTLARVQAAHAKEEYALSQIVASLKFVNHTVDAWSATSSPAPAILFIILLIEAVKILVNSLNGGCARL